MKKLSGWLIVCFLFIGIFVSKIDAQACSGYSITTTRTGTADPELANRGVPFFPECEENRRIYFSVQSASPPVMYLAPSANIVNNAADDFYEIHLNAGSTGGNVRISRNNGPTVGSSPAANLISGNAWADLYIQIDTDMTIHVGKQGSGNILSWKDDAIHDVNYILVQNYDGFAGDQASWIFCEGAVKLLTGNNNVASTLPVTSSSTSDVPTDGEAADVIDGKLNGGLFDAAFCFYADDSGSEEFWRVDLENMYDIKAVLVLNEEGGEADELQNVQIHVGSCATSRLDNAECGLPFTAYEADDSDFGNFWRMRECNGDYYGQYVILRQFIEGGNPQFSICEVEVWGQEIALEDRPKVGFTVDAISELEGDGNTDKMFTVTVQKTDGSSSHPTCLVFDIERFDPAGDPDLVADGPSATIDRTCPPDATNDYNDDMDFVAPEPSSTFTPTDTAPKVFPNGVTFRYDECEEDDEQFGYRIVPVTPGLEAGDANAITYEELTFTLENDDVTYCWEDIDISVLEGDLTVTAVLKRTGYLGKESTAVIKTANGDGAVGEAASDGADYEALMDVDIVFEIGDDEEDVVVTLTNDDCMEENDEIFRIIIDDDSDGDICREAITPNNAIHTVQVTIEDDDALFRFQYNGADADDDAIRDYTVSETQRFVEVVIEREGYLDNDVTIGVQSQPWTTDPSRAAATTDYVQIDESVPIAAGLSTASITVEVIDDSEVEPADGASTNEIFQLLLYSSTLDACAIDDVKARATIDIVDNDCCWSVQNETVDVLEDEGPVAATVLCERPSCGSPCNELSAARTVSYSVGSDGITDGSAASSPDDFNNLQDGTLTLPPVAAGKTQTSNTISVNIVNDIIKEETENFEITLTESDDGQIKDPSTTTVTILDDDVLVTLNCTIASNTVRENAGQLTITLDRSGNLTESDSVVLFTNPVTASDGKDYTGVDIVKTFNAGQSSITQVISITDDTEYETDEEFLVRIKPYSEHTDVDDVNNVCSWTIQDDDCTFSLSASEDSTSVTEGESSVSITIKRTGSVERPASIRVVTSSITGNGDNVATAGDDYIAANTVVEFQADDDEETITITINDDEDTERTEYFLVSLEQVDCSVSGDRRIFVAIEDNDESQVRMSTSKITVDEGNDDGVAFISIERTGSLASQETVDLLVRSYQDADCDAATPDSDFDNSKVTVEFGVDEDVVTVEIPVYDDTREEGLESFLVQIVDLSDGSDATIDSDNRNTVVCIRDNDGSFRIAGSISRSVAEGNVATVTISRSGDTSTEQTVYLTTSDNTATGGLDYQTLSGLPVVFSPGITSRTVDINTYDDQELEPRENFDVFLSSDTGNDLGQRAIFIDIEDDDHEIHFISGSGTTIIQNSAEPVSESAGSIVLTIERAGYNDKLPLGIADVSVGVRELASTAIPRAGVTPAEEDGNERDFALTETTKTFQSGQRTTTVEVDIIDDEIGENTEAFEIFLSAPQPSGDNKIVYPNSVIIYINDDDGGADPVDPPGGDGDGEGDGDDTTTVSQAAIVGIAGGVGLLILVGILGLIGLAAFARRRTTAPAAAAAPRRTIAPRPVYQVSARPNTLPQRPPPQQRRNYYYP